MAWERQEETLMLRKLALTVTLLCSLVVINGKMCQVCDLGSGQVLVSCP